MFLAGVGSSLLSIGCKPSAPRATPRALVDVLGSQSVPDATPILDRALASGLSVEAILGAAWSAPIVWGGLPSDVHAILVLPAILALIANADARSAHRCVAWAMRNAAEWCIHEQTSYPPADLRADVSRLSRSIARGEETHASKYARGLYANGERATLMRELIRQASIPREDVHASIYGASLIKFLPLLPADTRELAVAHFAQYLARSPLRGGDYPPVLTGDRSHHEELEAALRDTVASPADEFTSSAIWSALAALSLDTRLSDASPTGGGVHKTTHLAAMHDLYEASAPDRHAEVLGYAVGSIADRWRAPEMVRSTVRVSGAYEHVLRNGANEHTFKYWAAAESTAGWLSGRLRSAWEAETARTLLMHPH